MCGITFLILFLTWIHKVKGVQLECIENILQKRTKKIPHCTKMKDDLIIKSLRYFVGTFTYYGSGFIYLHSSIRKVAH
jgi:hypothetical protein